MFLTLRFAALRVPELQGTIRRPTTRRIVHHHWKVAVCARSGGNDRFLLRGLAERHYDQADRLSVVHDRRHGDDDRVSLLVRLWDVGRDSDRRAGTLRVQVTNLMSVSQQR